MYSFRLTLLIHKFVTSPLSLNYYLFQYRLRRHFPIRLTPLSLLRTPKSFSFTSPLQTGTPHPTPPPNTPNETQITSHMTPPLPTDRPHLCPHPDTSIDDTYKLPLGRTMKSSTLGRFHSSPPYKPRPLVNDLHGLYPLRIIPTYANRSPSHSHEGASINTTR